MLADVFHANGRRHQLHLRVDATPERQRLDRHVSARESQSVVQGIFDPLTTDTRKTRFVIGEFGIGLAVAAIVVAFLTWQQRGEVSGGSDAHAVHDR